MERWEKLVTVSRGALVESEHFGAVAVVDADGALLYAVGDADAAVFARSALKPFQALPVLASGAADAFGFGAEELALLCASHSGEPQHTLRVARMLATIGCTAGDLQCGCHTPAYLAPGDAPPPEVIGPLHNNCSGKHTGFLAYCRYCGLATADYLDPRNRLQAEIRTAIARSAGIAESELIEATDGCSAPTYALPLAGLARAYARLAAGGGPADLDAHLDRLFRAMTSHPALVSGTGRGDAFFMALRPGDLVAKGGAEGVQAFGLRSRRLGIALKIADGSPRAGALAGAAALLQLGILKQDDLRQAPATIERHLRNARGIVTGQARAVFRLRPHRA